jgi:hypothetical protein
MQSLFPGTRKRPSVRMSRQENSHRSATQAHPEYIPNEIVSSSEFLLGIALPLQVVLRFRIMRTTETSGICEIHRRPYPCLSCRGAKGGHISSPKKSAANRLKARHAAMKRWHRKEADHSGTV